MIRVSIYRRGADRLICGFRVTGHAGFADPGKDIVCAGVSAVTVGTVNAMESLLGIRPQHQSRKGFMEVKLPGEALTGPKAQEAQLLLASMLVMINTIEESYDAYVRLDEHFE